MTPRVSVIIPTIGRDSLKAAERSAAAADEIIVVPDNTGDHGYSARMRGMAQATGTHLAFLDDDDEYLPGAIEHMRKWACDVPVIFRMSHPAHGVLWHYRDLQFGNVGTPMFLVPNRLEELGAWLPHMPSLQEPGGDFTFIRGCVENMGGPVWREEIIATVDPGRATVAVVTPWHDRLELADDYFAAIALGPKPDELIVVDNGSEPALQFARIRLATNEGFAAASNRGLEAATSDVVVFLNNDVAAFGSGWLELLREFVSAHPCVLVGARLRSDIHGDVDRQPMPYLDGWCLAGRREDFLILGGFDEEYEEPSYYGDNDLCLRARAAGMTLREIKLPLIHKGQRTAGRDRNVAEVTFRNHQRFLAKAREILGAYV